MEGYKPKNGQTVKLDDGPHLVCDLPMVYYNKCYKSGNYKIYPYLYKEDVDAIANTLARELGKKLLDDGILKVEKRPDCVIVTLENILIPNDL